ncbi:MAG: endonuclease [Patescibacteria group bacterium]|nr:endonuclease [Patescibacteria group bacterium]
MNHSEFQKTIYDHYYANRRTFPWRETSDPYHIFLSEIMLQQTQTARVVEKYQAFLEAFPTVQDLAAASTAQVLVLWQGLGYNRRGLNLHRAAGKIVTDFGGKVPDRVDQLQSLPGIGPYTAGAIAAFAFNRPVTFIETNIRRVYLHFFFEDQEGIDDKQLMPLIEETLDQKNPKDWYYALMDYGSILPKIAKKNANRQSKHYVRQAVFEGSNRQVRGSIIRHLVQEGSMEKDKLVRTLGFDPERIDYSLEQLLKEGFIKEEGNNYSIN